MTADQHLAMFQWFYGEETYPFCFRRMLVTARKFIFWPFWNSVYLSYSFYFAIHRKTLLWYINFVVNFLVLLYGLPLSCRNQSLTKPVMVKWKLANQYGSERYLRLTCWSVDQGLFFNFTWSWSLYMSKYKKVMTFQEKSDDIFV